MRKFCWAIVLASLLPLIAVAQEQAAQNGFRNHGYSFLSVGGTNGGGLTILHYGVGGTARVYRNIGVSTEIGYIHPTAEGGFENGLGLFSINGSYHFASRRAPKVAPYVTVGYSGLFREGYANLVNYGAGVDYWFATHAGAKVEFRDHVWPGGWGTSAHLWGFRFGFMFR